MEPFEEIYRQHVQAVFRSPRDDTPDPVLRARRTNGPGNETLLRAQRPRIAMRPSDDRVERYNEQVDKLYRIPSDERDLIFRRITGMLEGQPDVSFAYVFGSSITGPAFHDIDIAVCLSDSVGDPRTRALELAEDLERDLEVPVDVQPLNRAPTAFAFHAVRGRLLFSRDDTRLADTIEKTVRSYLDVAPLVRLATREAFTR